MRTFSVLLALALCLAALPLSPLSASEAGESTAVRMPAAAYRASGLEAKAAFDYGSFVWFEATPQDLVRLEASGLPYQVYPDAYTLSLGEWSFDPLQGSPAMPAGWDQVRTLGPDLHLVQLASPTRTVWLDTLAGLGLQVVQYIHPFTYVVWGGAAAIEQATTAGFVRWTGPFAPAYRVLPQWRTLPEQEIRASVLMVRAAGTDETLRSIEAMGGQLADRANLNETFEIANLSISGARFKEAAQVPGVYSIQPEPLVGGPRGEMADQINVNNHDGNNQAFPGYKTWLDSVGLHGNGVVIANVDAGVQNTHPDLVNRMLPCTGQTCGGSAQSSHGTHTAGIMAADASSGVKDGYGFYRGLGMAPGANLVEQLYSPYYSWPDGMLLLMYESYGNGAALSGNSWGPSSYPQGYDNDTMQVDIGVRDADADAPGNQPFSFVLSIMNGNGGVSTQGTPDEAKNIFTVGSTKMQTRGGAQILAIDDLSSNTAHGPALDGRKIPHLVAPGCYVDSTTTGGYTTMCGTSMASPHVSGAVALFIEYYRSLFGVDPSPALIKAAFLPVAHDLAGHLDADGGLLGHPFDSKQGWGRMDAEAVLSPSVEVQHWDNPLILDNSGEEWVQALVPADPAQPVRLMLTWTDAPGHGLGGNTPAWNNDLDLVVEAGGDTYLGNYFGADGWSLPGGNADYRNNTEGIFLGPVPPAGFTVRVVAANIDSDGVPGLGDTTDQDLALVCYNCSLAPSDTMHIQSIRLRYQDRGGGRYIVTASLRVLDQDNQVVPGATVSAQWTLPSGSHVDQQAVTSLGGVAQFRLKSTQAGVFGLCVTDVTKPGWIYDPDQNGETCDSLTVP
jgi:subtilisin family serine protease